MEYFYSKEVRDFNRLLASYLRSAVSYAEIELLDKKLSSGKVLSRKDHNSFVADYLGKRAAVKAALANSRSALTRARDQMLIGYDFLPRERPRLKDFALYLELLTGHDRDFVVQQTRQRILEIEYRLATGTLVDDMRRNPYAVCGPLKPLATEGIAEFARSLKNKIRYQRQKKEGNT